MSKIVELNPAEVVEVTGGRKSIVEWFESVFGAGDPGGTDYVNGIKG